MFRSNLKLAFRALLRQKGYTIINVSGLAVGIASCLLIVLFIRNEFSFDRFINDNDRIYKITLERKYPDHNTFYDVIPHSYTNIIQRDFPEVEQVTRLQGPFNNTIVTIKDDKGNSNHFEGEDVLAGDSTFFQFFGLKMIKGDPAKVLLKPNDVVLTEETSRRYFGKEDPIGKIISPGFGEFKVTGICENLPGNTHFKFNVVTAIGVFFRQENFTTFSAHSYIKLKPFADPVLLESKFPKMVDTYAAAEIENKLGKSWSDYVKEGNGYRYFLRPLTSIHLDPANIEAILRPGGSITTVYIMIFVAILILVIACINFMNLATARSSERAKEVGIRKSLGSLKNQLVLQFLSESFVLSFISVLLAVLIVLLILPYFNNLIQKHLYFSTDAVNLSLLIAAILFIGLIAGIYPAFILSSFNPVVVMKGNFTGNGSGKWLRNGLVSFQFWISIILIISTLVIRKQMQYMQDKSLGFDKEHLLVVENMFYPKPEQVRTFLEEVRRMPFVLSAAGSIALPGRVGDYFGAQFLQEGASEVLTTKAMIIGDELAETLKLKIVLGRRFSEETNDSLAIMLNETALKLMNIKDPIGKKLRSEVNGVGNTRTFVEFTITGVVEDFNFQTLHDPVTPLVLQSNELFGRNNGTQYIITRIQPGTSTQALQGIEAKWKELIPEWTFKFCFLDEDMNRQYHEEQQTGKMFAIFSGLAIFVSCIGLFALSSYTTSLRTKEIGIRKVMGASIPRIVVLLSLDFGKMILVSFLFAVPIAWYMMENWWLKSFAYRTNISFWIFMIAGVSSFLVSWLTVSYQTIRAASKNPVRSLRNE